MISPHTWYKRYILAMMLVTISSCGGDDGPTAPTAQVPSLINLSAYDVVLTTIGATIQINATVLDQESRVITGASITWISNNSNVATVVPGGTVTAVSNGSTQIRATFGNASASATVTVQQEPATVTIIPDFAILKMIGGTIQLAAEVYDGGETVIPSAPVVWSSSVPTVATVNDNGLVTAASRGTSQIIATSGNARMMMTVSVEIPRESFSIALNILSATLTEVGQTLPLAVQVFDIDGLPIPGAPVSWSTSHPSVATVDDNGLVTAVFNGTAQITVTSGNASASARILVDISGTGPLPSADRAALIAFYNATGGPNWTNRTNWVSSTPIGIWLGVITDDEDRVVELRLRENNLAGVIPAQLGQLTRLRSMDFGANQLEGSLPLELENLGILTRLFLDGNQLSGTIPAEYAHMINLVELHLGDNQMSGPIPPELGQLINLRSMDLGENDLSGQIPPELSQIPNLEAIRLDNNRLTGNLPAEIGRWTRLGHLVLHNNQLSGDIPPELGGLESVIGMELHDNQLTGGIPPELGNLSNMKSLHLRNNRSMSGPLPVSLTSVNLTSLSLDSTQLCVPADGAFETWLASIMTKSGVMTCAP